MANEIKLYFHCGKCLEELEGGTSPQDFQRVQVGWTKKGVQTWCVRHDVNIVHLDFKGQKVEYAK